jgi:hypothetical protein
VDQKIKSRRENDGDKNWQSNLEIGGGFGWGMKFLALGPAKADGQVGARKGRVLRVGCKRWCPMKNPRLLDDHYCCDLTRRIYESVIPSVVSFFSLMSASGDKRFLSFCLNATYSHPFGFFALIDRKRHY